MKQLLVAALFVACMPFHACRAEPHYYATAQAFTYHTQRTQPNGKVWNEDNKGLGLEMELNQNWTLGTGVYNNSYFRETRYAGVRYSPDWAQFFHHQLQLGATVAYATGYRTPFVAGLTANTRWVGVLLAPKAGAGTSAFVSVALRWPL